ncbi:CBS domain-containing protein [Neptunicella sp. SCSIO 80796]|uniref:CBS domain-containing protein n=1 Tax=Neptunicella plasticusilytica TaxID=3117012 RepID=UPI003A4E1594
MESLKVGDYMNTHPVTLNRTMTVAEAVEKLVNSHYPGGPVVDGRGRLVGFLSEQDCLAKMVECSYYNEQAAHVEDIMRTEVLSLKPYDSVLDLAQQMLGAKPKVYPIVDDDGLLVGSICRADVLKAIGMHLKDAYKKAG